MTEFRSGNEAVVITIEDLSGQRISPSNIVDQAYLERLSDLLFRIGVLHLSCHHCEKLCTVLAWSHALGV